MSGGGVAGRCLEENGSTEVNEKRSCAGGRHMITLWINLEVFPSTRPNKRRRHERNSPTLSLTVDRNVNATAPLLVRVSNEFRRTLISVVLKNVGTGKYQFEKTKWIQSSPAAQIPGDYQDGRGLLNSRWARGARTTKETGQVYIKQINLKSLSGIMGVELTWFVGHPAASKIPQTNQVYPVCLTS